MLELLKSCIPYLDALTKLLTLAILLLGIADKRRSLSVNKETALIPQQHIKPGNLYRNGIPKLWQYFSKAYKYEAYAVVLIGGKFNNKELCSRPILKPSGFNGNVILKAYLHCFLKSFNFKARGLLKKLSCDKRHQSKL